MDERSCVTYDSTPFMRIRPLLWPALVLATVACSSSAPAGPGAGSGAGNDASSGDTGGTIPMPGHDCRVDDTSDNCISVAGTYDGKAIDLFCNAADGMDVTITEGKWVIGCEHLNPGVALLNVPIQKPGPIAETGTATSRSRMAFEFSADTSSSVAMFTNNLVRADLAGTIVVRRISFLSIGERHASRHVGASQWLVPRRLRLALRFGGPQRHLPAQVTLRELPERCRLHAATNAAGRSPTTVPGRANRRRARSQLTRKGMFAVPACLLPSSTYTKSRY